MKDSRESLYRAAEDSQAMERRYAKNPETFLPESDPNAYGDRRINQKNKMEMRRVTLALAKKYKDAGGEKDISRFLTKI